MSWSFIYPDSLKQHITHTCRVLRRMCTTFVTVGPFVWLCWLLCADPALIFNYIVVIMAHNISYTSGVLRGRCVVPPTSPEVGWWDCWSGPAYLFIAICPSVLSDAQKLRLLGARCGWALLTRSQVLIHICTLSFNRILHMLYTSYNHAPQHITFN